LAASRAEINMASKRKFFRPRWLRRSSRCKQPVSQSSDAGGATAPPRGNPAQAGFPGVRSGLAAIAIFACAFGPMPGEPEMIDATIGREDVGMQRKVIDNFLAYSRQYLGL